VGRNRNMYTQKKNMYTQKKGKTSSRKLKSGAFSKTLIGSPLILVIAVVTFLPLLAVYFVLLQNQIWVNWSLPLDQLQLTVVAEVFGLWAISAYCLILVAVEGSGFRSQKVKFDSILFGMRFLGRLCQLFFIIDFILLLLSPYIWASFFLIVAAVASFFIMKFAEFRIDLSVKIKDRSTSLNVHGSKIDVPYGGKLRLRVAGAKIEDFKIVFDSKDIQSRSGYLNFSHNEGQWEVSTIPIFKFSTSFDLLHKEGTNNETHIRTFKAEQEIPVIENIHVDIYINNRPFLTDEIVENFNISVDNSLFKLFNIILDSFKTSLGSQIDLAKVKYVVKQDRRVLNLNDTIFDNEIIDGSKIEIRLEN
jgi:hypothetical protein